MVVLNQCCAAFNPITTVVIRDCAEFADRRAMNVTTKYGINVVALRIMGHSGFEFTDEAHSILHRSFCVRAQRPVAKTETPPDKVNQWIERQQELVAKITGEREPSHPAASGYHHIEFVTMDNQDAFARRGHVDCVL